MKASAAPGASEVICLKVDDDTNYDKLGWGETNKKAGFPKALEYFKVRMT